MTTVVTTGEELLLLSVAKEEFKLISTMLIYDEALEFIYKKKPEFRTNKIFHELFPECFDLITK